MVLLKAKGCFWIYPVIFPFQREHEPAENLKQKDGQEMSKSAAKNKKKREAKARAKQEQEAAGEEQV